MSLRYALPILASLSLVACAGGTDSSTEAGTSGAAGVRTAPGGDVGVAAVPGTPVAQIPSHEGHTAIAQPPQPGIEETPAPLDQQPTREWYVAPSGSDSAAGSRDQPFRTIAQALFAVRPGERIHVASGTYAEKIVIGGSVRAGTATAKIILQGDGSPKIVPLPGPGAMVQVARPYWVIDGFEIDAQKQAQYAVAFTGDNTGTVLANSDIHHGALGAGITTYDGARGATIENNDIHHFSKGETDSHGVVVQASSRDITVRHNDIHDNSGDSVQCLGPEGISSAAPAEGLTIEANHLFGNRENAIDIKTCTDVVVRGNKMHGFRSTWSSRTGDALVVHYSARNVLIEGNDIFDAGKGISVGGNHLGAVPTGVVIRKNRIHDLVKEGALPGVGIRLENSDGTRVYNNTLTSVPGWGIILGKGTGGATRNLEVKNNIIDAGYAVNLGAQRPGLRFANNLYTRASFGNDEQTLAFDAFANLVQDFSSKEGDPSLATATLAPGAAAVDKGVDVGLPFCGAAPDLGAVETGC